MQRVDHAPGFGVAHEFAAQSQRGWQQVGRHGRPRSRPISARRMARPVRRFPNLLCALRITLDRIPRHHNRARCGNSQLSGPNTCYSPPSICSPKPGKGTTAIISLFVRDIGKQQRKKPQPLTTGASWQSGSKLEFGPSRSVSRRAEHFLVALPSSRDLLLCARHLRFKANRIGDRLPAHAIV